MKLKRIQVADQKESRFYLECNHMPLRLTEQGSGITEFIFQKDNSGC